MGVHFGGQIRDEHQGPYSAIVRVDEGNTCGGGEDLCYSGFLYPIGSEDYISLTGTKAIIPSVERAYIGVSKGCSDILMRLSLGEVDLGKVSRLLVWPHFLNQAHKHIPYYGGQIKEDARGGKALIIAYKDWEDKEDGGAFLYDIGSEEYLHITGVGSVNNPIERAYIGVSPAATDFVSSFALTSGKLTLESIDEKLVNPLFLGKVVKHLA